MTKKVCAVVGVGPGIGLSVARRFARESYTVVMMARSKAKLESYDIHGNYLAVEVDATDGQSTKSVFDTVLQCARAVILAMKQHRRGTILFTGGGLARIHRLNMHR